MSTLTMTPEPTTGHRAGPARTLRPIPLTRLTRVEFRKMLDTLAGRWFLAAVALICAVVLTVLLFTEGENVGLTDYIVGAGSVLAIFIPILGILSATAEWSQRTGMATFTLEPRRGRVVVAKIVASLALGLLTFAVAVGIAAACHALAVAIKGAPADFSLEAGFISGMGLMVILGVLQGTAFGFLLRNTPAAIVAYLVLPLVYQLLTSLISGLREIAAWTNITETMGPLSMGESLDAEQWAQLATSVGIWVLIPLVIGSWRVVRAEVK